MFTVATTRAAAMSTRNFLAIDGSVLEGGGQILRNSVALSALLSSPISIENIRQNRKPPGLRAQHAAGIRLAAEVCSAKLSGCSLASCAIEFEPGPISTARSYSADPGTAGSVTLLLQIALPCLLFSQTPSSVNLTLRGGTNANKAPQIDYAENVFLPFLRHHFGLNPKLDIRKRGYYPRGGGEVHFSMPTIPGPLPAITLIDRGRITSVRGKAYVAGLPRRLAEQMRDAAVAKLASSGIDPDMVYIAAVRERDQDVVGSGSGIMLWAETENGCVLGGSSIGLKGKDASKVGEEAAAELALNIGHGGGVDEYLQDQIIIFLALAQGKSTILSGPLTLHTKTAIWVAEQLTNAKFDIQENTSSGTTLISCVGIGYTTRMSENAEAVGTISI